MLTARDSRRDENLANRVDFSHLDSYNDYYSDIEDSTQDHCDGDRGSEIQIRDEESLARIDMFPASKRSKSVSRK